MAKGRKPLPTNVHLLQGNRRKIPVAELASRIITDTNIPECPTHLDDIAIAEWDRIAPELEAMGCISLVDMAALAAYCHAFSMHKQITTHIKTVGIAGLVEKTNDGYKRASVWHRLNNDYINLMHKFLIEFGFSPSSRSRVMLAAKKTAPEEEQSVKRFFNN